MKKLALIALIALFAAPVFAVENITGSVPTTVTVTIDNYFTLTSADPIVFNFTNEQIGHMSDAIPGPDFIEDTFVVASYQSNCDGITVTVAATTPPSGTSLAITGGTPQTVNNTSGSSVNISATVKCTLLSQFEAAGTYNNGVITVSLSVAPLL